MQIQLNNTVVSLLPQKALLLPEEAILVIADIHLGKAAHFRKSGIFIPGESVWGDLKALYALLDQHHPGQVWFLGDLFHSSHNTEWQQVATLVRMHPDTLFTLIKGNHDILDEAHYEAAGISVTQEPIELDGMIFSHEPMGEVPYGKINVAGHIHPGCTWRGKGRQTLRLPCFYLRERTLLLPAFGALTGLYTMDRTNAVVFAVLPGEIVRID